MKTTVSEPAAGRRHEIDKEKIQMKHSIVTPLDPKNEDLSRHEITLLGRVAQTGSRPFLAMGSNGCWYWCKPPNNRQGPETVIAEVAAGVLGNLLEAPIPEWTTLRVRPEFHGHFIKEAEYALDGRDVFASRVIDNFELDVDDSLDNEVLQHVKEDDNFNRIPTIYAMWFLCNAEDIQFAYDPSNHNSIFSFDHGYWFGQLEKPWGFGNHDKPAGRPTVPTLCTPIPNKYWDSAIRKLDLINSDLIQRFGSAMPTNWNVDYRLLEKIAGYIQSRKDYTYDQLNYLKNTKGGE